MASVTRAGRGAAVPPPPLPPRGGGPKSSVPSGVLSARNTRGEYRGGELVGGAARRWLTQGIPRPRLAEESGDGTGWDGAGRGRPRGRDGAGAKLPHFKGYGPSDARGCFRQIRCTTIHREGGAASPPTLHAGARASSARHRAQGQSALRHTSDTPGNSSGRSR